MSLHQPSQVAMSLIEWHYLDFVSMLWNLSCNLLCPIPLIKVHAPAGGTCMYPSWARRGVVHQYMNERRGGWMTGYSSDGHVMCAWTRKNNKSQPIWRENWSVAWTLNIMMNLLWVAFEHGFNLEQSIPRSTTLPTLEKQPNSPPMSRPNRKLQVPDKAELAWGVCLATRYSKE